MSERSAVQIRPPRPYRGGGLPSWHFAALANPPAPTITANLFRGRRFLIMIVEEDPNSVKAGHHLCKVRKQ